MRFVHALRMWSPSFGLALAMGLVVTLPTAARDLSIEKRIQVQEIIERIHYSHRIGASLSFEEAVPHAVIEEKVRRYLKQSVALETFWGVRITGDALERELQRIAVDTRLPGRLQEIYRALGEDPVLLQECFVRPVLVERLSRSLFARNTGVRDTAVKNAGPDTGESPSPSWDEWWSGVRQELDETAVRTVARSDAPIPRPAGGTPDCIPDDTWRHGTFDDVEERDGHTATWTGTLMLVWGGQSDSALLAIGRRYDPLTDTWSPMSVAGAPTARSRHTAVWTGDELIVWGGWDGGFSGTGGRYDPVTDTWAAVSTVGAPASRENHRAVWTGDEMIVWGGRNGPLLNTGGRYDPASNTWTATSTTGAPAPRQIHSAVWTGNRMMIWGGTDGAVMNTGGRYNPNNDSWTSTTTTGAPVARRSHTAVWTGDRVVIWGGLDDDTTVLDSGGRYNPNNDSWSATSTTDAPEARYAHTTVWTGDVMVVWGGVGDGYLDSGGRYDPDADSWTATSTEGVPLARFGHTAVWTDDQMIVWGGSFFHRLNSGGRYDPVSDTWTPTAPATPEPRAGHSAVWTGTHLLIWGGSSTNLGIQNTGNQYDPLVDAWVPISTTGAPVPRTGHTAVWTGNVMVVWGGTGDAAEHLDTGGRYNPLNDTWAATSTTGAPEGRIFHTAVWTGQVMVVWGGFPELRTGGRYDPVTDTWSPTSPVQAPLGRYWHTAVWTGELMLVWGGYNEPVFLNSGSRYDPELNHWIPMSQSGAPEGRFLHTAVWTGERMIVWGGNNLTISGSGTRFDTGGLYDPAGNSWTPTPTLDAPTGRDTHTAIWTGKEMVVWGGQVGPPFTPTDANTGGRLDPTAGTWKPTSTTDAPTARRDHTATWTGSDLLVWGGIHGPFNTPDYPIDWGKYALGHASDDDGDLLTECDGDCDDANPDVFPGAPELCDNRDNDCDGQLAPDEIDDDADGSPQCADCDDTDPSTFPGAPEQCDNLDNDCDMIEDEFVTECGLGECASAGFCSAGVDTCVPGTPSAEICDGLDNDCDGELPADEIDSDEDGLTGCEGDCNDANAFTHPGAIEVNDGEDNQCIGDVGFGLVDEITGQAWFENTNTFCWPAQPMAVVYEPSRSDEPDQPVNCDRAFLPGTCWFDSVTPPSGGAFYYLVRADCQYLGSLGADSEGHERIWGCEQPSPGCPDQ